MAATDVFISYSRKDSNFVRRLHDALLAEDKNAWVDWEDIPPSAEWLSEINTAIEGAHTFIFVLSPDSVNSDICRQEIEHAAAHNKRLIPIVCREINTGNVPETLAKLNWIFFDEKHSFNSSFKNLMDALNTDLDWVYSHTRLLTKAIEWNDKNRDRSLLLRGGDLKTAEEWLAQSGQKEPAPTNLQTRYIFSSQKGRARRQQIIVGSITFGFFIAIILALVATYYSVVSEKNRKIALSRQLSAQALQIFQQPDEYVGFYDRALLLAVQAVNIKDTYESRDALFRVLQANNRVSKPFIKNLLGSYSKLISDLAFSPDGRWIASACWDGNVRLWDRAKAQPGRVFPRSSGKRVYAVSFSPDSRLLASGHELGQVRIWDLETLKQEVQPLVGHKGALNDVAFNHDGTLLASAGRDKTVLLWDVRTRKPLKGPLLGPENPVQDLIFSPDGKQLVGLDKDGSVWLWDLDKEMSTGKQLPEQDGTVLGVAFCGDGNYLARVFATDDKRTVQWWNTRDWEAVKDSALPELIKCETDGKSTDLRRDGKQLASIVSRGIPPFLRENVQLWDVKSKRSLGVLSVPGREVKLRALAFSPDGAQLAIAAESAGYKTDVWLWDVKTRMPLGRQLRGHRGGASGGVYSLSFSPDSKRLASAGFDGTIRLWDPLTGKPSGEPLQVTRGRMLAVAFSPDGRLMASGGADRQVRLWDSHSIGKDTTSLGKHEAFVLAVAFSPDSGLLASAGEDKTVRLWDVTAGTAVGEPLQGHKNWVNAVVFSPDGKLLASASDDGTVSLWNPAMRTPVGEPIFQKGAVKDVAFSPDGKWLAIALANRAEKQGEVWLWDTETKMLLNNPIKGHTYSTHAVAFSPDSSHLATGGGDETIRLWDVNTLKPLGKPLHGGGIIEDVAFSPDGRWLAAADQDAKVRLWDMDWRSRACRMANRNLSLEEWQRYLGQEEVYSKTCETITDKKSLFKPILILEEKIPIRQDFFVSLENSRG